jgi:hypothetical protein
MNPASEIVLAAEVNMSRSVEFRWSCHRGTKRVRIAFVAGAAPPAAGYKRLQIDRESHYKGLIKGLRAKDVKGFPARIKESSQRK